MVLFLDTLLLSEFFANVLKAPSVDQSLLYECSKFQSWDKNISFLQQEFDLQSLSLSLLAGHEKKRNPLAQWASKFQFSLAPTSVLLADMAASMEIREQMWTKTLGFLANPFFQPTVMVN